MNEFGGYEGNEDNDILLDRLLPRIRVQARAVVDDIKARGKDPSGAALVVTFRPEPDCRATPLSALIEMMERRGEAAIAHTLRTWRLPANEQWLAIQRYEDGGGVIVMARLVFGEVDVASLLN